MWLLYNHKKKWVASCKLFKANTYLYEIFADSFDLTIFRKNQVILKRKVKFSEINKRLVSGNYAIFLVQGSAYIFKRVALVPNSIILALCGTKTRNRNDKSMTRSFKVVSVLLIVLSFLAIMGTFICFAIVSVNNMPAEKTWVVLLFATIPLLSVLFGCFLKCKGVKSNKNVVFGLGACYIIVMLWVVSFIISKGLF